MVSQLLSKLESWLRKRVPHKELGWKEIDEKFTRFVLLKTRWFSVYLHKLDAPIRAPLCHDHPWHFWTFVLGCGYNEEMNGKTIWRGPWTVLYRTARSSHNTITLRDRPNWSLLIVSNRVRDWRKLECRPVEKGGHWLTEHKDG